MAPIPLISHLDILTRPRQPNNFTVGRIFDLRVMDTIGELQSQIKWLKAEMGTKASVNDVYSAEEVRALTVKLIRMIESKAGDEETVSPKEDPRISQLQAQIARMESRQVELQAMLTQQQETIAIGGWKSLAASDSARTLFHPIKLDVEELRIEIAEIKQSKADSSFCRDKFSELNLKMREDFLELQLRDRTMKDNTTRSIEDRVQDQINRIRSVSWFEPESLRFLMISL